MSRWYRVFAALDTVPDPAGIEACLAVLGLEVCCTFASDEAGWYRADLACGAAGQITVERFLAGEEGIRAELNAWAGYVETLGDSPTHQALMERIIQSRQLITVEESEDSELGEALCQHLAREVDGFFQADQDGFRDAEGDLLLAAE
jgi:hypothetical protein